MKRYTMTNLPSGHVEPVESDDGEWVRLADVRAHEGRFGLLRTAAALRRLVHGGVPPEETWPSERRGLRVSEDDETTEGYEVEAPASPASSRGGPLRAILAHTRRKSTTRTRRTAMDADETRFIPSRLLASLTEEQTRKVSALYEQSAAAGLVEPVAAGGKRLTPVLEAFARQVLAEEENHDDE